MTYVCIDFAGLIGTYPHIFMLRLCFKFEELKVSSRKIWCSHPISRIRILDTWEHLIVDMDPSRHVYILGRDFDEIWKFCDLTSYQVSFVRKKQNFDFKGKKYKLIFKWWLTRKPRLLKASKIFNTVVADNEEKHLIT